MTEFTDKEVREVRFFNPNRENGYLSNYFETPFFLDGYEWASVEHYYQAHKFKEEERREKVRKLRYPNDTKRYAHDCKDLWIEDWEEVKVEVMRRAVEAKFSQSESLKELLLATSDAILIENSKRDYFWGIGQTADGMNMLGKVLMEVRGALGGYHDA